MKISKATLEMLGVQDELNMDLIQENDYYNLNLLIESVYYKKWIPVDNKGKFAGFFRIANLNILVRVVDDSESGLKRIMSFFEPNNSIQVAREGHLEEGEDCPMVAVLNCEAILKADNLSVDAIVEQMRHHQYGEVCAEQMNRFLLELILAYDTDSSQGGFLDMAEQVIEEMLKLDKHTPSEMLRLNQLQIIKRRRDFHAGERCEVENIASDFNDNAMIATGAYLLLDNQSLAEKHYYKLSVEEQEMFSSFPIFKYWKA